MIYRTRVIVEWRETEHPSVFDMSVRAVGRNHAFKKSLKRAEAMPIYHDRLKAGWRLRRVTAELRKEGS